MQRSHPRWTSIATPPGPAAAVSCTCREADVDVEAGLRRARHRGPLGRHLARSAAGHAVARQRRVGWRSRRSRSAEPVRPVHGRHTAAMSLSIHVVVDQNRERLERHRGVHGAGTRPRLVVDAHLDAIFGAGMLDDASGSAMILEIAAMMRTCTRATSCGSSGSVARQLGAWAAVLRRQPRLDEARQHRLVLDRGRDGHAELPAAGILDPAVADPVRPHRHETFPTACTSRPGRRDAGGRATSTRSARTQFLAGRNRRGQLRGRRPARRCRLGPSSA